MTDREPDETEALDRKEEIGGPPPSPPLRRRSSLHDAHGIKSELIRLYKDARAGRVPPADASRLGNLLELLRRGHETAELAQRVESIEGILKRRTVKK